MEISDHDLNTELNKIIEEYKIKLFHLETYADHLIQNNKILNEKNLKLTKELDELKQTNTRHQVVDDESLIKKMMSYFG